MLKILREDLPDPVVLGIGPEVRVESAQLVSGACANGLTDYCFIGIEKPQTG